MKQLCAALCVLLMFANVSAADDLPSELLLKCDLKQTAYTVYEGKNDFSEIRLSKTFKLKDGALGWADNQIPIGTDCRLNGGEIYCEWKGIIPLKEMPGLSRGKTVEKRHSKVVLSRNTGEINLILETWGYSGESTKGEPYSTLRLIQSGVCRSVGKPLF